MVGFDEEVYDIDSKILKIEGEIKELNRKLTNASLELTRLLHKKKNLKYNFRSFYKGVDGWYTFKCITCGNRDKSKTKGAKYCSDCKRKHKESNYEQLGWMPYARKSEDSI